MENTLIFIAVIQVAQLILLASFHILYWNSKVKRRVTLDDINPPTPKRLPIDHEMYDILYAVLKERAINEISTSTVTTKASDIDAKQTNEQHNDPNYRTIYPKVETQGLLPKSRFQTVEDVEKWCEWYNAKIELPQDYMYAFISGASSLFKAMQSEKVKDVSDHAKGKKGCEK